MSLPELPHNSSRREMRKALIRLRMEMHRQEIRHEAGQVLQPLQRMRGMTQTCKQVSASSTRRYGAWPL